MVLHQMLRRPTRDIVYTCNSANVAGLVVSLYPLCPHLPFGGAAGKGGLHMGWTRKLQQRLAQGLSLNLGKKPLSKFPARAGELAPSSPNPGTSPRLTRIGARTGFAASAWAVPRKVGTSGRVDTSTWRVKTRGTSSAEAA